MGAALSFGVDLTDDDDDLDDLVEVLDEDLDDDVDDDDLDLVLEPPVKGTTTIFLSDAFSLPLPLPLLLLLDDLLLPVGASEGPWLLVRCETVVYDVFMVCL